jgi:hypothetical protein
MQHKTRKRWIITLTLAIVAMFGIVISLIVLGNCDVGLWGSLSTLGS